MQCKLGKFGKSLGAIAGAAALVVSAQNATANELAFSETVFDTDFVSAGVGGLRGQADAGIGDIVVSGVGAGVVTKAILYWNGPTDSGDANVQSSIELDGNPVVGTNIGISHDNCWGFEVSNTYVADVTGIVTGDGTYTFDGSGVLDTDVELNGASLVVFFDDGIPGNNRDVVVFHGNDSNISNPFDADGWNATLNGINYSAGTANMEFHVSDGQSFQDAALILNAMTLVPANGVFDGNTVPGTDPTSDNPATGNLWDIRSEDITAFLTPGVNNLTLQTGVVNDCVAAIAILIDLPEGAAPRITKELTSGPCLDNPANRCEGNIGDFAAAEEDFMDSPGTNEVVAGVPSGGCAWDFASASGLLSANGNLSVSWEALLIDGAVTSPPAVADCSGIDDTTASLPFYARIACDGGSTNFDTSTVTPVNNVGDGAINTLGLLTPAEVQACVDPTLLIVAEQGANDQWVAYAPLSQQGFALAVEAPAQAPVPYDFDITLLPSEVDPDDVTVYDGFGAEWDVYLINSVNAATGGTPNDEGVGIECGTESSPVPGVTLKRGGNSNQPQCQSSTALEWEPTGDPGDTVTLHVDLLSRPSPSNGNRKQGSENVWKPTFCGALYLNHGALLSGPDGDFESNRLVVAALHDLNGSGIDPTGQGDEDEDLKTDIDEVRMYGTDPCFTDMAALSLGWDRFDFPLDDGKVFYEQVVDENFDANGTKYVITYYIDGGMADHEYQVGLHYFVPSAVDVDGTICPTGTFDIGPVQNVTREGHTACVATDELGVVSTDGNGDGVASFMLSKATGTYDVQFTVREGVGCLPDNCAVVYRTGTEFGVGFETLNF